jgi:glycosyltransferase involved in cell wall biosynthesis
MSDYLFFDLMIVDDIYPSTFSPFRTLEYNHYMWFFDAAALSLEGWHLWVENNHFDEHRSAIDERFRSRVFRYTTHSEIATRLAYVTFLKNAVRLLPYFERRNIPFILQLYPGGGFAVDIEETDEELRAVLLHPLCRKVITTQRLTERYIIDNIGCDPQKVEFIFGGVFNSDVDFDFAWDKKLYGRDKDTLDLCFVAHKYGNDLSSKGYDYFVEVAKRLVPDFKDLRLHVVGDYQAEDIDLGAAATAFTFYGKRPQTFFGSFYPKMDAIISFNRPFTLAPGAFDGFPTGACLEAAFRGVANIINDPLGLNVEFQDGRDILLIDDDFEQSLRRIHHLLSNPSELMALGEGSCKAFGRVMDINRQLWLRTKIIADELQKHQSLVTVPMMAASSLDNGGLSSYREQVHALETEVFAHRAASDRRSNRLTRRITRRVEHFVKRFTRRGWVE